MISRAGILLVSILLLQTSCLNRAEFSPEEIQALVDRELERKLEQYQQIRMEKCREDMLERADAIVDSILFFENSRRSDTIGQPRTRRPAPPSLRPVPDTRPLAPLFQDLQDSLRVLDSLRGESNGKR
jgi:hypothetical protein